MTYPNYELIENICKNELKQFRMKYPTCIMRTFPQTWSNTATGFQRSGMMSGQAITNEYTTVVEASGFTDTSHHRFYFVFFGNGLAYMVTNPSDIFYEDLKNMNMKCVGDCGVYDYERKDED